MNRRRLNQHDILTAFDADASTWFDVAHYPDTVTCRRIVRFADWAAAWPEAFTAARRAYLAPELSYRELAILTGMPKTTLTRLLGAVEIIDDPDDYSDAETAWAELAGIRERAAAAPAERGGSETFRRAAALAEFAADNPARWRAIRAAFADPDTTQTGIAAALGVAQSTVSRYIATQTAMEEIYG